MLALLFAFWTSFLITAATAGVKRTIDDTNGDSATKALPLYAPDGAWNLGHTCDGCFVKPDKTKAHGQTWHDTTQDVTGDRDEPRTITMVFPGTAVTVYGIMDNHKVSYTTATYVEFRINGTKVGDYAHEPTSDDEEYLYDVPVYTNIAMPNGTHTLTIMTVADGHSSLFLFDYLEYVYEPPAPTTSSPTSTRASRTSTPISSSTSSSTPTPPEQEKKTPIGAIVGGVVGGLAILAALLAFFLLRRRRAKSRVRDPALVLEYKDEPDGGHTPAALPWGAAGAAASTASFNPYQPPPPGPTSFSGLGRHGAAGSSAALLGASSSVPPTTPSQYPPSSSVPSSDGRQPYSGSAYTAHNTVPDLYAPHMAGAISAGTNRSQFAVANPSESGSSSAATAAVRPAHPSKASEHMQSQINELKAEVERLRANPEGTAPPAYPGAPAG